MTKTKIIELEFKKGEELSHETLMFLAQRLFGEITSQIWIKDKLPEVKDD
jgi:hypothetical protein